MHEFRDLYSTLLKSASNFPDKDAIVELNGRRWTYDRLLLTVDRTADALWQLGVRPGDRVAIILRNGAEFILTHYALAKIGAAAVPVNFLISKTEEIRFILEDSGTKGIITQEDFMAPYKRIRPSIPAISFLLTTDGDERDGILNFGKLIDNAPSNPELLAHYKHASRDTVASVLYTSGTTGHPKGVLLSHGNLIANARSSKAALHVHHDDVFLCLLPMFHTFSWTTTTVLPLMLGASALVVSHITPAKPWLNMMGAEGVTVMAAIPQVFSLLAKEAKGFKRLYLQFWAFRKTRFAVSGAAPLSDETVKVFEENINVPLLEGYGLTETGPVVSVNQPSSRKTGSVGKPLPEVHVRIVDENGRQLSHGEEGEICVRGENITKGYHGNPGATSEIFTDDGWLRTGDIGTLDQDGFLFIRDRKKDMIIIKGLKVFSAQVEQILCEHPLVGEAAVIGIPDGKGDEIIKAFIVPREGQNVTRQDVMRFIKDKLDPYKRPRDIEIVEKLPKNSLQKVLKRELRKTELEKLKAKKMAAHAHA